jgi:hypothetical protein
MTEKEKAKEKVRSAREFLPFWAKVTLEICDQVDTKGQVEKSSLPEDS